MIRQAISPRLAIRIFENMTRAASSCECPATGHWIGRPPAVANTRPSRVAPPSATRPQSGFAAQNHPVVNYGPHRFRGKLPRRRLRARQRNGVASKSEKMAVRCAAASLDSGAEQRKIASPPNRSRRDDSRSAHDSRAPAMGGQNSIRSPSGTASGATKASRKSLVVTRPVENKRGLSADFSDYTDGNK